MGALPKQSNNQQSLKDDQRESGKDVLLVSVPDSRLAIQNDGAGRKSRLG